jgi:hypothetical protein
VEHFIQAAVSAATDRLELCYAGRECDWERFFTPLYERGNFATRYHLVYPGLAYFLMLKQQPDLRAKLRPQLETMYRGLLAKRTWSYWHSELDEESWPLQERNLTYAGRLATFVGFFIDAFGEPPAKAIQLAERSTNYSALSERLWRQMKASPSCSVSCYNHESMVMCMAHLLINNILHDRLFGTDYSTANAKWLDNVDKHLVKSTDTGAMFFYGTQPNSIAPVERVSVGADIWTLFLMSGIVPERVSAWFTAWRRNITEEGDAAYVGVRPRDTEIEFTSKELATAWAFCLAKELDEIRLAAALERTLRQDAATGFTLDPLLSGLYLLGHTLRPGDFHRLVQGEAIAERP